MSKNALINFHSLRYKILYYDMLLAAAHISKHSSILTKLIIPDFTEGNKCTVQALPSDRSCTNYRLKTLIQVACETDSNLRINKGGATGCFDTTLLMTQSHTTSHLLLSGLDTCLHYPGFMSLLFSLHMFATLSSYLCYNGPISSLS
jgi:hypothetical protein